LSDYYKDQYGGLYFVGSSDRGWTIYCKPAGRKPLVYGAKCWGAGRSEVERRLEEMARAMKLTRIEKPEL